MHMDIYKFHICFLNLNRFDNCFLMPPISKIFTLRRYSVSSMCVNMGVTNQMLDSGGVLSVKHYNEKARVKLKCVELFHGSCIFIVFQEY